MTLEVGEGDIECQEVFSIGLPEEKEEKSNHTDDLTLDNISLHVCPPTRIF
jgi:hypothetical protein